MREKIDFIRAFLQVEVPLKIGHLLGMYWLSVIIFFLAGWMVFGWLLFPVEWIPDRMNGASAQSKISYVHVISEWYAYSENAPGAIEYLSELDGADIIACNLASVETQDLGRKARYIKIAYLLNGQGCK